MPPDKIISSTRYLFPPTAIVNALIFFAVNLYYWPSLISFLQNSSLEVKCGAMVILLACLYYFYYLFYISMIIITEKNLIVSEYNSQGYPEWFSLNKQTIDIKSVTKVIIYPQKYDARFLYYEYGPVTSADAKIVILAENKINVPISSNYYDEEQIQRLIAILSNRNENIKIIESGIR